MPRIRAEHLSKYYGKKWWWRLRLGRGYEIGVEDVNLTIEQGEFVFIIGSSGSGKSTLLKLLSGQIKPDKGNVYVGGQNLKQLGRKRLPLVFGHVSQHDDMIRRMTIKENLERSVKIGPKWIGREQEVEDRIRKVLGLTGMLGVENRFPGELSIGERRRVELARALINSPPILILDEMTANLDEDSVWDVFLLLTEINRKGTTVIMSTHSSRYVNMLRRRVITLVDGRIYGDVDKGRYGEVSKKKSFTDPLII